MEVLEMVVGAVTLTATAFGANKVIDYKVEQALKETTRLEVLMTKKVDCDSCELHRKAQVEKCGMIHSGMDRMMAGIDRKFEQISEQLESMRTERKNEISDMTSLLREFLNDPPTRRGK